MQIRSVTAFKRSLGDDSPKSTHQFDEWISGNTFSRQSDSVGLEMAICRFQWSSSLRRGSSVAGSVGSSPVGSMEVSLVSGMCCQRSLRQADL
jgi:hypothetical protein